MNGDSFKSIDPTPSHASAHPIEHSSSIAFSIHDNSTEQASTVSIEEITTRQLKRLKESASDYLGKPVTSAVITVPTNFEEVQKKAIISAAKATDLDILQFINEPAAALLAYDARNTDGQLQDKNVVLADFGGTRTDIAVIASRGGMYTVLATSHDYDIGGAALDETLIDYAAKEFIKKHKTDPRTNERALSKLKLEAESVKKALSIGSSATFSIESLADGHDFTLTVNRSRYELIANKILSSFTRLVESTVKKAELDLLDINEIVLSGGTSHTPKVSHLLQSAFPTSTTITSPVTSSTALNPSELSVRGAAIQASLIAEFDHEDIEQNTHPAVTVIPHLSKDIGVVVITATSEGEEETFMPVVQHNTAVPLRRTVEIPVSKDGGDVLIKLCEGVSEIKVTKPLPKEKTVMDGADDEDDDEEEEEDLREKVYKVEKTLAEAALKRVKKGGKVEVQISVGAELEVSFTAREVGGKGGVRGELSAVKV